MPKLSFIIAAHSRPNALRTCLSSIVQQTFGDWEALVCDNAEFMEYVLHHCVLCEIDKRIQYYPTCLNYDAKISQYHSSKWAAANVARGEWLCFPSDDSYYVFDFASKLLAAGETGLGCDIPTGGAPGPLDLVGCDFVWGRRDGNGGNVWTYCDFGPQVCHFDKTVFIVRREWFERIGWQGDISIPNYPNDGLMAEKMVAEGARVGRVVEQLCVHNP